MSEHLVPSVEIELDRPRRLVLDMNALAEFREVTGHEFLEVMLEGARSRNGDEAAPEVDAEQLRSGILSSVNIRAVLYAALKTDDPEMTVEKAGSLVHFGNMTYVIDQLTELITVSVPQEGKAEPIAEPVEAEPEPLG